MGPVRICGSAEGQPPARPGPHGNILRVSRIPPHGPTDPRGRPLPGRLAAGGRSGRAGPRPAAKRVRPDVVDGGAGRMVTPIWVPTRGSAVAERAVLGIGRG